MTDAAIFIDFKVRKLTSVSEVLFQNKTGFVTGFVFDNIKYSHIYSGDFRPEDIDKKYATAGFYDQAKFLQYLAKKIKLKELPAAKLSEDRIPLAVDGDTVIVQKLRSKSPYTDFCKVDKYTWDFIGTEKILDDDLGTILLPARTVNVVPPIDILLNPNAKDFYANNIHLITDSSFQEDKDTGAYLISLIALQIHRINKDIFPILNTDADLSLYITNQNFEWTNGNLFINATLQSFQEYLDDLTAFYNSAFANQVIISSPVNEKIENRLYWLGYVLPINGLKIIPVYNKILILKLIAAGTILGEISGVIPNIINEEEYVIKIVQSIDSTQASEFLAGLTNFSIIDDTKDISLFQALYDKVNDRGIGAENLKILINELYKIWLLSTYNPYNLDGTVKDNLINSSNYTSKAVSLNYESEKVFWIFNLTNYNFYFNKNKIDVIYPRDEPDGELLQTYDYFVGSYDLYQTLTITNSHTDTNESNFISVLIDGQSNAALPIFYLKYLDDKKETENLVTTMKITFDLVLLFSGIGNLGKLAHLRELNALGRVILGLDTIVEGQTLIAYELAQGIGAVIQIGSSVASIIVDYFINYQSRYCDVNSPKFSRADCEFYTKFHDILLVLQLFSGALDVATSVQLRKASQNMLAGPIPNDFHPDALAILQKFAGDVAELTEIFRVKLFQKFGNNDSAIWQKLNDIPGSSITPLPAGNRADFIYDFSNADSQTFDALNANNGELIDFWNQVSRNKASRVNFKFLLNFKYALQPVVIEKLKGIVEINGEWMGGHLGSVLFDTTKPIYGELDPAANVLTKSYGGQIIYKQIRKSPYLKMISGNITKTKASWHTWADGLTESEFAEEVAYAITKAKKGAENLNKAGARLTRYKSSFSDGCPVTLVREDPYLIGDDPYDNHLSAVLINPEF
ncbi:hypothetical protein [Mucilaginibacter aquaedulcis]|uniref:hypothetical protein n=1 Tax=Mucilaginibacter aquaedulcis TaxID=1187081 RepID=UPI0025B39CA8|nr:hypothetical protein [Mucilaginibacter aquaedulcis]MDN3548774.1 hypothetical protein [Mucilaginibacter aquaedulcis]